jgi:predicted GNAT family acetyltransferase
MSSDAPTVTDRPERDRYEIAVGDQVAFLTYRRHDDRVLLAHTEVPESLRGQGLGQLLAKHALDEARRTGSHVIVKCPFVTAWLRHHRDYDDIVIARVAEGGEVDRQPPREPR